MTEFHDAPWIALPEGAVPDRFVLRRAFVLENVDADERVLDLGCGDGAFAAELATAAVDVVGVDVSAEALRRARAAHPELDLRQIAPDDRLPFEDASFDVAWAGEVLTHVVDLAALLSEVRRVLRPKGRLLLTTPNHSRRAMLALALSPRRFGAHFDPRSQHVRFFTASTLRGLLADMGFAEVRIRTARSTLLVSAVRPDLGRAR